MPQIPTTAAHLALVASRTGKNLSLDEVGAVIDAINALGAADETVARTGNTADHQAAWFAGMEQGQANAQHNAAIRGAWLPIESAPKDGRRVLLWNERYNAAITGQFYGLGGWKLDAEMPPLFHQPTHWMPLPPAPGAPASPVSTVEQGDVQDEIHALRQCAIKYLTWLGVSDPQASLDSDLRNPGMVNKPITMTHPTARDWKAINAAVKEYLDGYEMEGDGGYYVPNNRERAILDDAVAGLLADDDFLAHMSPPAPAAGDALDAATEALRILRAARGSIRNHQVSGPTSLSTDSRALVNADDDILQAVKVLKGSLDAAQRKGDA